MVVRAAKGRPYGIKLICYFHHGEPDDLVAQLEAGLEDVHYGVLPAAQPCSFAIPAFSFSEIILYEV